MLAASEAISKYCDHDERGEAGAVEQREIPLALRSPEAVMIRETLGQTRLQSSAALYTLGSELDEKSARFIPDVVGLQVADVLQVATFDFSFGIPLRANISRPSRTASSLLP